MTNIKDTIIISFLLLLWVGAIWALGPVSVAIKTVSGLLLVSFSLLMLNKTSKFQGLLSKLGEVKLESAKITWAKFSETKKTVIIVCALVAVFSVLLWLVDTFFTAIIKLML